MGSRKVELCTLINQVNFHPFRMFLAPFDAEFHELQAYVDQTSQGLQKSMKNYQKLEKIGPKKKPRLSEIFKILRGAVENDRKVGFARFATGPRG